MRLERTRRDRRRQWVIALAVLLTTAFVAGPALADDRRSRDRYRHDGYQQRHDYQHHDRRHHRRYSFRHHRGYPVYVHGGSRDAHHEAGYFCGPCNHRFANYGALSHHVHRQHHIPLWQLPFVIVDSVVGGAFRWIFHG